MELTPEETAKKIILLYLNANINFPYIDTQDGRCIGSGYMTHKSAKLCALIHVNALMEEVGPEHWGSETDKAYSRFVYYEKVKQAMEKIG